MMNRRKNQCQKSKSKRNCSPFMRMRGMTKMHSTTAAVVEMTSALSATLVVANSQRRHL